MPQFGRNAWWMANVPARERRGQAGQAMRAISVGPQVHAVSGDTWNLKHAIPHRAEVACEWWTRVPLTHAPTRTPQKAPSNASRGMVSSITAVTRRPRPIARRWAISRGTGWQGRIHGVEVRAEPAPTHGSCRSACPRMSMQLGQVAACFAVVERVVMSTSSFRRGSGGRPLPDWSKRACHRYGTLIDCQAAALVGGWPAIWRRSTASDRCARRWENTAGQSRSGCPGSASCHVHVGELAPWPLADGDIRASASCVTLRPSMILTLYCPAQAADQRRGNWRVDVGGRRTFEWTGYTCDRSGDSSVPAFRIAADARAGWTTWHLLRGCCNRVGSRLRAAAQSTNGGGVVSDPVLLSVAWKHFRPSPSIATSTPTRRRCRPRSRGGRAQALRQLPRDAGGGQATVPPRVSSSKVPQQRPRPAAKPRQADHSRPGPLQAAGTVQAVATSRFLSLLS